VETSGAASAARSVRASRATPPAPVWRTSTTLEILCDGIAEGQFLANICAEFGWPKFAVYQWSVSDPEWKERISTARRLGAEYLDAQNMEIADNDRDDWRMIDGRPVYNGEAVQRSKLRIYVRDKRKAILDPDGHAERKQLEVRSVNINVDIAADPIEAARQYQEIMRG
jgi:hypothetical protein